MREAVLRFLVGAICAVLTSSAAGGVGITEFLASNLRGITDEDGQHEDWIEIQNDGANIVSLNGWYLTDAAANLTKWRFPNTNVGPGEFLIVFASNKDRRTPGKPLHTNFKLSASGEYLALVQPDGTTIATQFAPTYPPQATDVSYGIGEPGATTIFAKGSGVAWKVWTSAAAFDAESPGWNTNLAYATATWSNGTSGLGWDTNPSGVDYTPCFGSNASPRSLMSGQQRSLFARFRPVITNVAAATELRLRMKYDDGFMAWLNGTLVAADLAPDAPSWDSLATGTRSDSLNGAWAVFDLPISAAVEGTNLLAIQTFNTSISSSDLLVVPELDIVDPSVPVTGNYFLTSTPGATNSEVALSVPATIELLAQPARPTGGGSSAPVTINTRVSETLHPVTGVTLYYCRMFAAETAVPMTAGTGGVYTATIPTTSLNPGEMLRWRIEATDSDGDVGTAPRFLDANDDDRYFGTVALNAAETNSALPMLHWFLDNSSTVVTTTGGRCAFFYRDRFYDNVLVTLHGQSTASFPKHSHNLDFNANNRFHWRAGEREAKDVKLLSNWADKSKVRNTLAYEMFGRAGVQGHWAFPVRVQGNGDFHGIMDLVEDGDDRFLERIGLDPDGALYKVYNAEYTGTTTWSAEKKSRKYEGNADLITFCNYVASSNPLAVRRLYFYDNVNVASTINYLATLVLMGCTDQGHKNFYLYRDSNRTGEWRVLPWDVDLTFGHDWFWEPTYFDDNITTDQPLQLGYVNNLKGVVFSSAELNQMFLRRLRTLMDTVLQPDNTPTNQRVTEARIAALLDQMDPPGVTNSDADLDFDAWGWWTQGSGAQHFGTDPDEAMRPQAQRIVDTYLPDRRRFLELANPLSSGDAIPASQLTNATVAVEIGDFNPVGGNQEQEYVRIRNTNSFAVDLSGWKLSGGIDYEFPPGTVVPSGGGVSGNIGLLFVVKNPQAFRERSVSPAAQEFCLITGPYAGQLSARGETVVLADDRDRIVSSVTYVGSPSLAQQYLRITELMYNPAPLAGATNDDAEFEFVELRNLSTNVTLELDGISFTNGILFAFTNSMLLAPGQNLVLARNPVAFAQRHGGGDNVVGPFEGYLDNVGERLTLLDAVHEEILDFSYNNSWYPITDGLGFSLVVVDELAPPDSWNARTNWRASGTFAGSPGAGDVPADFLPVKLNEALTHTDLPQVDSVELYNPTTNSVNLGGWFLTDDFFSPKKFRLPADTVIPPQGYLVFDENQFNGQADTNLNFRISSTGDDLWLFAADGATNLTGYYHGFSFGAAANGVSFGRHVTSTGEEHFVAQRALTLGGTNAGPLVGLVVLQAIMYHPPDLLTNGFALDDAANEFIEVLNVAATNVPLYSLVASTNTWRLNDAVEYAFPTNLTLAAGANLIVVSFNPTNAAQLAAFRARWALPTNTPVLGPWTGKLDNSTDDVKLERPDAPNLDGSVPYILVERAQYSDQLPWSLAADGLGANLQRTHPDAYPNDPASWQGLPQPGVTMPDGDGDGICNWWETEHGLNPLTNDAALDPDRDGCNNLQEYLARTDPQDAASQLALELRGVGSGVVLSFDVQPQVSYAVQTNAAPDGSGWQTWQTVAASNLAQRVTLTNAARDGIQFYRLRVPAN